MSLRSVETDAPPELAEFASFCEHLVLEDGKPMVLYEFQRRMLSDYFDGATETLILISKKNGKSSLLAALALFHLVLDAAQRIYIAAASRDQASILFDQAAGLVRRSPGLAKHVDVKGGYRELRSLKDDGRLKVLAADADTADGVLPTVVYVDELHRHKSSELYGVLRDGLGPRDGRMVTISTAGTLEDSPLGTLRRKAYELGVEHDGCYRYAANEDRTFVMHEWALEPEADVSDMRLVKQANPAPWHNPANLKRRFESPSTTDWQWKRFACGIWTEGEQPWIDPNVWDSAYTEGLTIPLGSEIVVGVDLGVRHDSTAIVLVHAHDTLDVQAQILVPTKQADVEYERVERALRGLARDYHIRAVAYDPWGLRRSAEMLTDEGLPMVEFPMSAERMSIASANLYQLLSEGRIRHSGDPRFRSHVLAGVTKNTERGWRLVKDPKARRPIDALIALAMACQLASTPSPQPFVEVL